MPSMVVVAIVAQSSFPILAIPPSIAIIGIVAQLAFLYLAIQLMRRRRMSWRVATAIPAITMGVGGLLYLWFSQLLTWPGALIWLVYNISFYVSLLVIWWVHGSTLEQHGFRW